jgi:hypothetical protein
MIVLGPWLGGSWGCRLTASRVLRSAYAVSALALLLTAAASAGCERRKATLSDLNGVEELKTRFNRDAGKPRLVLLLSPT